MLWTLTCDPLKHEGHDVILELFVELSIRIGERLTERCVDTLGQQVGEILWIKYNIWHTIAQQESQ